MASVRRAIADGADWVEIDVQESRDGQVVVFHDSDFMKLSGNPLKIWDGDLLAIQQQDIGSWFAPEFAAERVPTLAQVLEEVAVASLPWSSSKRLAAGPFAHGALRRQSCRYRVYRSCAVVEFSRARVREARALCICSHGHRSRTQ